MLKDKIKAIIDEVEAQSEQQIEATIHLGQTVSFEWEYEGRTYETPEYTFDAIQHMETKDLAVAVMFHLDKMYEEGRTKNSVFLG